MSDFLKRLKLIQEYQIEVPLPKHEFIKRLQQNVEPGRTGLFSSAFEPFSSNRKPFKGEVNLSTFKIRRRKKVFDRTLALAVATGSCIQQGDSVIVKGEINGMSKAMIPYYIFVPIFYILFLTIFFSAGFNMAKEGFFVLPFILIHGAFMLGLPLWLMRKSVQKLKYDLEREFFYFSK